MHKCSFCGEFHVKHLVKGEAASICSDCLEVAQGEVWKARLLEFSTVRTWLSLTLVAGVSALFLGGAL